MESKGVYGVRRIGGRSGVVGAGLALERLRQTVEQAALGVTVSIGVATLLPSTLDAIDLLDRADDALYRANSAGRKTG